MESYPFIIKLIHWLTLLLILGSLSSSFVMYKIDGTIDDTIINAHAINGSIILTLTLIRLIYRAKYGVPQASGQNKLETTMAMIVHRSFYIVILLIVSFGLISFATRKLLIMHYNIKELAIGALKINVYNVVEISSLLHSFFISIFLILLALHILGFIYHQFIIRKNIITKMWFSN